MNDVSPLRFIERFYRARETAKVSLQLAGTMGDILYTIERFCERNNIPLDEGIIKLMDETTKLLRRIEEINSLPLTELLRTSLAWSSDETLQGDKSDGDLTEPESPLPIIILIVAWQFDAPLFSKCH